jgi:hypothetical protein
MQEQGAQAETTQMWTLNVVDLAPRASLHQPRWRHALRAAGNWGPIAVMYGGAIAGILGLFMRLPMPVGTSLWYQAPLAGGVAVFLFVALLSLRDQYRRSNLYQRAGYYLHMLAHNLRDELDLTILTQSVSKGYVIGDASASLVNDLLFLILNDIRDVFIALVHKGSVMVNLLIPVAPTPTSAPTHLNAGLWSAPYDDLTAARRAEDTDGKRYRSKLDIAASIAGRVWRTKRSILVRDMKRSMGHLSFDMDLTRTRGAETYKYVRSLICVPVVLRHKPVFVLTVDCSSRRQFHPDYIDIARQGADLLALVCKLSGVDPEPTSTQA